MTAFVTTLMTADKSVVEITLTPRPRTKTKANLAIYLGQDTAQAKKVLLYLDENVSLGEARDRKRVSSQLALSEKEVIIKDADLQRVWQQYGEYLLNPAAAQPPKVCVVRIGGLYQPRSEFTAIKAASYPAAFKAALETTPPQDGILEWDDISELAILDLDYHQGDPPARAFLDAIAQNLKPIPCCFWSTPRGLHAVYLRAGIFTAEEMATSAAFFAKQLDLSCDVEVISRTRHPHAERTKAQ